MLAINRYKGYSPIVRYKNRYEGYSPIVRYKNRYEGYSLIVKWMDRCRRLTDIINLGKSSNIHIEADLTDKLKFRFYFS